MEDGLSWDWHKWFAWFPIEDDYGNIYWLVYVERKQDWAFKSCRPEDGRIVWRYRKI